ncbi:MAG TPA: tetratricopeptide repeat protein [Polyangia bacterium]
MRARTLALVLLGAVALTPLAARAQGGHGAAAESTGDPIIDRFLELVEATRHDAALAHIDAALARDPFHVAYLNLKGLLLFTMKRSAEARATLHTAMGLDPGYYWSYQNLAKVEYDPRRPQRALQLFDQAVALGGGDDLKLARALMAHRPEHEAWQRSSTQYWNSRTAEGRAAWVQGNRALERRDFDDALEKLKRCLALEPDHRDARQHYALVLINEKHRWDEAIRVLTEGLRLHPYYADYHQDLAHCHLKTGSLVLAQRHAALAARYGAGAGRLLRELRAQRKLELRQGVVAEVRDGAGWVKARVVEVRRGQVKVQFPPALARPDRVVPAADARPVRW